MNTAPFNTIPLNSVPASGAPPAVPELNIAPTGTVNVGYAAGSTAIDISNAGDGTLLWTAQFLQNDGTNFSFQGGVDSGSGDGQIVIDFGENTDTANTLTAIVQISGIGATSSPQSVTIVQAVAPVYSIRERILENIKTTMETITTGNGYANTVAQARRWRADLPEITAYPYIEITAMPERYDASPNPLQTRTLQVQIDAFIQYDPAIETAATDTLYNTILADMEKAVLADHTRSGLAIDTTLEFNTPFPYEQGLQYLGISLVVNVKYRTQYKNPYA